VAERIRSGSVAAGQGLVRCLGRQVARGVRAGRLASHASLGGFLLSIARPGCAETLVGGEP